jgi:alkyl hydroperoxide reductase subunit AhpC
MSQNLNKQQQDEIDEDFFDNIGETDYVFIVDKDGNLKTMLCPDNEIYTASDQILLIMKTFGINLHDTHTLH